jgi:hypothetical protein
MLPVKAVKRRWEICISRIHMMTCLRLLPILGEIYFLNTAEIAQENRMALSDQATGFTSEDLGASAREFVAYCDAERERRFNSGEAFDQTAFDEAVEMVVRKLRILAEEGWT